MNANSKTGYVKMDLKVVVGKWVNNKVLLIFYRCYYLYCLWKDSHYPRFVPAKFHAAIPADQEDVEVEEIDDMNWQEILSFVNNTDF